MGKGVRCPLRRLQRLGDALRGSLARMAERTLKPKSPSAQVARKVAGTSNTEVAPGRNTERYLLPSRRVAVYLIPNVGEFIELRERAAIKASKAVGPGAQASNAEFGYHLGELGLRKLLVGISLEPVPIINKAGFNEEALREEAAKDAAEAVAEWVREQREQHNFDVPEELQAEELAKGTEARFDDLLFEAEDSDAMRAAANPIPVTDFMWDNSAAYLRQIQSAEIGTLEAADWLSINDIVGALFTKLTIAAQGRSLPGGPFQGTQKRKIRRWR
jgi:hypothetical protein